MTTDLIMTVKQVILRGLWSTKKCIQCFTDTSSQLVHCRLPFCYNCFWLICVMNHDINVVQYNASHVDESSQSSRSCQSAVS